MNIKDSQVLMPGFYGPKKPQVYISGFYEVLTLINSKRKPRRVKIFGSDGKSYDFLLKGHEDLRQDERVMQSLSLVNTLLNKSVKTERKNLAIITYPVIPMSTNTGLLGWVHNCDTLHQLVVDHRKTNHTVKDAEFKLLSIQVANNYQQLCLPHKLEIYRYILDNTRGEDLKKSLWMKSENAEIWFEKRTNYVRSLATMSMVGYILGLGDRHLSNLMLQRGSGKIVHIDFGDLFEVTMTRKDCPEKVPFRLTRLLIKAMEACGIEGNYRKTCVLVMEMIRENRDSLLSILESFITDPLLNWRLIAAEIAHAGQQENPAMLKQSIKQNFVDVIFIDLDEQNQEYDGKQLWTNRDRTTTKIS
jgi:FKBP12-rapamycin complex-associated protein